jgi:crotonobetainyl-CoA:carnitine CoA-transferase CaiB-like acyl-CoA transferase
MSAAPLPLEGIRVVDFTAYWAGPLPTAIMADLGAEVIKVESIQRPDQFRILAVSGDPAEVYEMSPPFNATNRNKLGLTLDLARPEGVRLFKELVRRSDAVVQNYSPRVMPQLGLSYESLREVNPAIVMTSVSGFGQEGPWRDYVSFAAIGEALSGISGLSGYTGEGALIHGVGVSDPFAGYLAAFGTLAAVHHARATGAGQHVDVSQLEASMQYIADALIEFEFTGRPRERATSDDSAMAPHGAFPARGEDAWVALSVATDQQWHALLAAIDASGMKSPEWTSDARFATPLLRRRNRTALNQHVAQWTARFDRHELARDLQSRGVPAAPVLAPSDLLKDPDLEGAGFFQYVDHPTAGRHPYPSFPARIDGEHPPITRVGPMLGEDNHYVLSKILGLGDAEIARLEADRIIGTRPLY